MSPRVVRFALLVLVLPSAALACSALVLDGCSSDTSVASGDSSTGTGDGPTAGDSRATPDGTITGDAGADARKDSATNADGSVTGKGETCNGFGKGKPCGENNPPRVRLRLLQRQPPGNRRLQARERYISRRDVVLHREQVRRGA